MAQNNSWLVILFYFIFLNLGTAKLYESVTHVGKKTGDDLIYTVVTNKAIFLLLVFLFLFFVFNLRKLILCDMLAFQVQVKYKILHTL